MSRRRLQSSPVYLLASLTALALWADSAVAQSRPASRPIAAPRAFGVQRGGLGVTGPSLRPSNRPSAYRSAVRGGQWVGGRNLGAIHRGDASDSFRRNSGLGACNSGVRPTGRPSPRLVGRVPGINLYDGYYRTGPACNTISGYSWGSGFSRGGYGYYGGCGTGPYGLGGAYGWRYPVYGYYVGGLYDSQYNGGYSEDVFSDLSVDVDEQALGNEPAQQAWDERERAATQAEALNRFGERQQGATSPLSADTMSPSVAENARQIGIALGRGDRAFEGGMYEQARDCYIRALVLAGDEASARIALGLADYALGSLTDASAAIRRGVARSPSLAASDFDLRAVYGRGEDFATHRRILTDHVEKNPSDLDAKFLLGFVRFFSGDRDGGRETLNAYLADPRHDDSVREFIETARVAMPRSQLP